MVMPPQVLSVNLSVAYGLHVLIITIQTLLNTLEKILVQITKVSCITITCHIIDAT